MADLKQYEVGSALLSIDASLLTPTEVVQVGCEVARVLGPESGRTYWSTWASDNPTFSPAEVETRWPQIVEHADGAESCIERLARSAGWLPFAELDRSTVAETMEREAAGGVYRPVSTPSQPYDAVPPDVYEGIQPQRMTLPPWEPVEVVDPPQLAPCLIEGLLRCGHVGILSAKAKCTKSWVSIELAVAVATGRDWLGFSCSQGRVLYLDPEIARSSFTNRVRRVAVAMGADLQTVKANVRGWSLRGVIGPKGKPPTLADVTREIESSGEKFALVIIDSVSVFVEGDENSSTDVRRLFAQVLRISEVTGGSVMLVHHEGKAQSGDRDASSRSRGSSVWADAPDLALSLVELFPPSGEPSDYLCEGERALRLECAGIREFGGFESVNLIWKWPTHRIDAEGVAEGWKAKSSQQQGGKAAGEVNRAKSAERASRCLFALASVFIREGIGADGISATDAADKVSALVGEPVKPATLKRYVEDSDGLLFSVWQKSSQRWLVVPTRPPAVGPRLTE